MSKVWQSSIPIRATWPTKKKQKKTVGNPEKVNNRQRWRRRSVAERGTETTGSASRRNRKHSQKRNTGSTLGSSLVVNCSTVRCCTEASDGGMAAARAAWLVSAASRESPLPPLPPPPSAEKKTTQRIVISRILIVDRLPTRATTPDLIAFSNVERQTASNEISRGYFDSQVSK